MCLALHVQRRQILNKNTVYVFNKADCIILSLHTQLYYTHSSFDEHTSTVLAYI